MSSHRGRCRSVPGRTPASGHRCTRLPRRPARHPSGRNASGGAALARRAVGGVADAGRPPAPRDGRHVPGHHGAEWPRGTRRHGPRLADRASSAGTVCKTIRVRSNCALVCRRDRPASGTSSFTMRTDVAASDPPSDSARSPRRRPIRGARGEPHLLRSPIPIHSRTVHWVRWNPMQNEGWSEGNKNPGML